MAILMDDFQEGRNQTSLPAGVNSFTWKTKVKDILTDECELQNPWANEKVDVLDILSHRSGLPGQAEIQRFSWTARRAPQFCRIPSNPNYTLSGAGFCRRTYDWCTTTTVSSKSQSLHTLFPQGYGASEKPFGVDALAGQAIFLLDEKRMFRISFSLVCLWRPRETRVCIAPTAMQQESRKATSLGSRRSEDILCLCTRVASGYILVNWLNKSFDFSQ